MSEITTYQAGECCFRQTPYSQKSCLTLAEAGDVPAGQYPSDSFALIFPSPKSRREIRSLCAAIRQSLETSYPFIILIPSGTRSSLVDLRNRIDQVRIGLNTCLHLPEFPRIHFQHLPGDPATLRQIAAKSPLRNAVSTVMVKPRPARKMLQR